MNNILLISFSSFLQKYYQTLPEEIANQTGVNVTVVVPPYRKELWSKKKVFLESRTDIHFDLKVFKTFFPFNLHFTFFRNGLGGILKKLQPDIVDIENEAFNIGTFQIIILTKMFSPKSKIIIRPSQNKYKSYPFPFNFFEKYNQKRIDACLARNSDAKKVLQEKGFNKKIELITHGVDTNTFIQADRKLQNTNNTNKPVIGYVGALTIQKDIVTLLNAVVGLNCSIIIAGDGDQKQNLVELAKKNNLDATFKHAMAHEEIIKIMQHLDIFILPSKTMDNLTEKFGRVIIEAMSCGVPVIGSDSGEIPVVIADAGLIFKESDVSDLNRKLKLLLTDENKRAELSRKGRERVQKNYSWKVIAGKTIAVYKELLGEQ